MVQLLDEEQFETLDSLISSVNYTGSATPLFPDERLQISIVPKSFSVTVTDTRVVAVDVRVNGRVRMRNVPLVNGACTFSLPFADMDAGREGLAMVEVIGRGADGDFVRKSGGWIRNHLVFAPYDHFTPGFQFFLR